MKKIIRFIGGPPGTGKSDYAPCVVEQVQEHVKMPVCHMDGDQFFTPMARVLMSQQSGIKLDSKKFAQQYNLPAQLRFQKLIRTAADEGLLVIATAPFENMFELVKKIPLWEKMRTQDFAGYDIHLTYLLLAGEEQEVEKIIQHRLIKRASWCKFQEQLDANKITDPRYYAKRAALVRQSVETFGFPLIEYQEPRCLLECDVVERLAGAIIASL